MRSYTLSDRKRLRRLVAVLILLVLVLLAIRIRLRKVNVMGTRNYEDEDAIDLVFSDYWDSNTFLCLINNILGRKKDLPFIADYDIVLTGPFSCDLIVYEKSPVGCIDYMGSFMYFDSDGIIIESSAEHLTGIPVIKGVSFGHIVLGEELPVEDKEVFSDVMTITQQLDSYKIQCEEIFFSKTLEITLTVAGGDIDVQLGTNENISSKISVLNDMLPSLVEQGLKGTLNLTNYSEQSSQDAVSFRIEE